MKNTDPITKKDFELYEIGIHKKIDESIEAGIGKYVNGKIDKLSKSLNEHIVRVEPMIEKYETGQKVNNYFSNKSDFIVKASSVVTAIGVILGAGWLIIGYIQHIH